MSLSIAIIGLPNVGKSTLFNALTKNQIDASNYPFCTIDSNIGVVSVPDERLEKLAKVVNTGKIVPAVVEFVDIAGLVKGASQGEGLGNKFLANIRECDVIVEVVREFSDKNVVHVSGEANPQSDIETIKTELILADLETMEKTIIRTEKQVKAERGQKKTLDLAIIIKEKLNKGEAIRDVDFNEEGQKIIKSFHLLSSKPHFYVINSDKRQEVSDRENKTYINAKIESELSDFKEEEKQKYLIEFGFTEPGLNILIKKAYELLGLETFFTASEKEVRAWTIKRGSYAPEAAGAIHTDFQKGFIKADVINWRELVNVGGWIKARKQGKVCLEGKDYIVQDGDVMLFKFNV